MTDSADVPNSTTLTSSDVLRSATFTATASGTDNTVPLTPVVLSPGWYAIMFGSDRFGATGSGAMGLDNTPVGPQSYFRCDNESTYVTTNLSGTRFFASGTVPEPSVSAGLLVRRRNAAATEDDRLMVFLKTYKPNAHGSMPWAFA